MDGATVSIMDIRRHHDLEAFAELAVPLLHADPVRHSIAATQLAAMLRPGSPADLVVMITVHHADAVLGAVLQAAGLSLIASALPPDAAPAVVDVLAADGKPPPGVTGPRENAEAFAAAWCRRTGATAREAMAMRLFALAELRPPAGVPGAAREAGQADIPLLARWRQAFGAAALPSTWPSPENLEATVARQLAAGQGNLLWELDGSPVSMAVASAPVAGMSRISSVWTPPSHRGHGFGSAVTAAASRWAIDAGAPHVVLFTDLTNPVSNSIYVKLGYRPVHDAVDLAFEVPAIPVA